MPTFYEEVDVDVDVDDFLSSCNKREINDLIEALVEDGHLPKSVLNKNDQKEGRLESQFSFKVDKLKEKYYSISKEDEEVLENIFKKYL